MSDGLLLTFEKIKVTLTTIYKLTNKGIDSPLLVEYPLFLHITSKEEENNIWIIGEIPFPDNYPLTTFHKELLHKGIAILFLKYNKANNILEIDTFYVYSSFSVYKKYINPHEEKNLKGLGKYMLCKVIHFLVNHTFISLDTTVTLLASGNQCYEPIQYDMEDCLIELSQHKNYYKSIVLTLPKEYRTKLEDIFEQTFHGCFDYRPTKTGKHIIKEWKNGENMYDKHPEIVITFITSEIKTDPDAILPYIRELICKIKANQKLITYYQNTYQFTLLPESNYGIGANLQGTVKNIVTSCEDVPLQGKRIYINKKSRNKKCKRK